MLAGHHVAARPAGPRGHSRNQRGDVADIDDVLPATWKSRKAAEQHPANLFALGPAVWVIGTIDSTGIDAHYRRAGVLQATGNLLRRDLRLRVRTVDITERQIRATAAAAGQGHRRGYIHDRVQSLRRGTGEYQLGRPGVGAAHLLRATRVQREDRRRVHHGGTPPNSTRHRVVVEHIADHDVCDRHA
jgi:hypothetical protein